MIWIRPDFPPPPFHANCLKLGSWGLSAHVAAFRAEPWPCFHSPASRAPKLGHHHRVRSLRSRLALLWVLSLRRLAGGGRCCWCRCTASRPRPRPGGPRRWRRGPATWWPSAGASTPPAGPAPPRPPAMPRSGATCRPAGRRPAARPAAAGRHLARGRGRAGRHRRAAPPASTQPIAEAAAEALAEDRTATARAETRAGPGRAGRLPAARPGGGAGRLCGGAAARRPRLGGAAGRAGRAAGADAGDDRRC